MDIKLLKDAFSRLLTYTYFDKSDMFLRRAVAEFALRVSAQDNDDNVFNGLLEIAEGRDNESLQHLLDGIHLIYLPKTLTETEPTDELDKQLISNKSSDPAIVKRAIIKAYFPIELCILDVAWIMEYLYVTDFNLGNHLFGNRLDIIESGASIRKGNALYQRYHPLYKKWWGHGLSRANKNLKDGEDTCIVNFDIANFYHSIDFNFDAFIADFEDKYPAKEIGKDPLTDVVRRIYQKYWNCASDSKEEVFQGDNKGKCPLPLSLLSAHILANWYLKPLDDYIINTYHPIYYGRYVDDCMIVKTSVSKSRRLDERLSEELPGLFQKDGEKLRFGVNDADNITEGIRSLAVQTEKLYIYHFDCEMPQTTIENYVEEMIDRSSEYRFLTDDIIDSNVTLESVTLVNALDAEEQNGRRLNILEDNKYKLSVYLSKINVRLARAPKDERLTAEVEKIYKYFSGRLLIKHYLMWEKLLTVFVLAGNDDCFNGFVEKISAQIEQLNTENSLFVDGYDGCNEIKTSLSFHLLQCALMARSLEMKEYQIDDIYLHTFMMRTHYNIYPMQEFSSRYLADGVRVSAKQALLYSRERIEYRWIPYYVPYYQIVSFLSVGCKFDPLVYKKAWKLWCGFNRMDYNLHHMDWIVFCNIDEEKIKESADKTVEVEFNTKLALEKDPDALTVSMVEMDMFDKDPHENLSNYGLINPSTVHTMQLILDRITETKNTDLFVMPELSLPVYELMEYLRFSAKKEVSFVTGLEYIPRGKHVYNHIVTSLPITLYGQKDAVPIIRLKHHYAPVELNEFKSKVPKQDKIYQILYHWKGQVFTTYYCYELANVRERSYFFSKIDAMYCPVFNRDTPYYNNIAESCARDMHCYFVLGNVSHYGDTRVTQPTSSVTMNILRVKGGNTENNPAVVLTTRLNTKELREFQTLDELAQFKLIKDGKTRFKQTPPEFDHNSPSKRGERFVLVPDNVDIFNIPWRPLLTQILQSNMEYLP